MIYRENEFEIEILRIGVISGFRKKGIGMEMISYLKKRNKPVILEVSSENIPAISLYRKAGFKLKGSRREYYPDGSDALLMEYNGQPGLSEQ